MNGLWRLRAAALSLPLLLLFSCAGKESPSPSATASRFEGQSLYIALFQGGYGEDYWKSVVQAFRDEYPDSKITYKIHPQIGEIIRPDLLSGSAPDLLYLSDSNPDGVVAGLIKNRALTDITDVFDGSAYDKDATIRDLILPGLLESPKYSPYGDSRIYLAPVSYGPLGLIYNKTLFQRKNWSLPRTWDEFYALGETARSEGYSLITYPGIYPGYLESLMLPAIADAAGTEGLNRLFAMEEGSVRNPEVMEAAKRIRKIADQGLVMPGSAGLSHLQAQSAMMLDKALFIPSGIWILNEMISSPRTEGFQFALMETPTISPNSPRHVQISYEQIMVPKDARNPEFAKEFLKFIYSDYSVKLFAEKSNGVYALKGALNLAGPYLESSTMQMYAILEQEDTVTFPAGFLPVSTSIRTPPNDYFFDGFSRLLSGETTVEDWADAVEVYFAEVRNAQEG